jgi:hypothetical protein
MRLIPNGKKILELSNLPNAHQLALRSRVSYPTVDRYINCPEETSQVSAVVMAAILTEGLGLTPEQVLDLRVGDLFQFVNKKNE